MVVSSALILFLITWLVAAFGFVMGLMLIGLPVWAGLSRLGWMSLGASIAAEPFLRLSSADFPARWVRAWTAGCGLQRS